MKSSIWLVLCKTSVINNSIWQFMATLHVLSNFTIWWNTRLLSSFILVWSSLEAICLVVLGASVRLSWERGHRFNSRSRQEQMAVDRTIRWQMQITTISLSPIFSQIKKLSQALAWNSHAISEILLLHYTEWGNPWSRKHKIKSLNEG